MQIPRINVRLQPEYLEQLRALAEKNGCRISDIVRQAIREYLDKVGE